MKNSILGGLLVVAVAFALAPALAEASGKDKTPPRLNAVHIESNASNPSEARAGDRVSITFTATEKVTPIVLVETKSIFVRSLNAGGNSWEASYTVNPLDREGRVDYLITVVDTAGNAYACASRPILIIPACPSDGSIVTIVKTPAPDTTAPVISGIQDYTAQAIDENGAIVSYTQPTALDDVDGAVAVVCAPLSGALFPIGATTVSCSASDLAGNEAQATFVVTVDPPAAPPEPVEVIIASQQDESTLCAPDWRQCYTGGILGERIIDLGKGSDLGSASILSVTIAKDETSPFVANSWIAYIYCYTDAAHTQFCPDWVEPNSWNASQTHIIAEHATTTLDNKHWTAYFTDPNHESNFDGSHPVTFKPEYYYTLHINDNGWDIGAYGSATEPYWVLKGLQ
jgi:hypothetical protein